MCDIIKRIIELMAAAQPGTFTEQVAADIERQLRHEYGGEVVYMPKRADNVCEEIAQKFNGKNVDKLARELSVSRRTIYRAIKKRRDG